MTLTPIRTSPMTLAFGRYEKGKEPHGRVDIERIHRSPPRIAFLIGAGASKDMGMPLVKDMLSQDYYETLLDYFNPISIELLKRYSNATEDFETLLRNLYHTNKADYDLMLEHYEEVLYSAECKGGRGIQGKGFDEWFLHDAYYFSFVAHLNSISERFAAPTCVISFNHDLWLEYSTLGEGFNYGSISNKMYGLYKIPKFPEWGYNFTLLKLHGSFSYLLCDSCGAIACGMDYMWRHARESTCLRCGRGGLKPAYIPPLKEKDNEIFSESWEDARFVLRKAEILFIVGYSMPEYDKKAKKLLADHLNRNAYVYIVDKYAARIAMNYSFLPQRKKYFKSIGFKDFIRAWNASSISLETFIWFR